MMYKSYTTINFEIIVAPLKKQEMKKYIILWFSIFHITQGVLGQIGIGTTSPEMSTILDVSSQEKGVLFPRMTTVQRNAISNPANGLIIFNLDEHCLQTNTGSSSSPVWVCEGNPSRVVNNCSANGFEGVYINGVALTSSNKFSITITNNSFTTADINFSTSDLVLSGISGISVSGVSITSVTLSSGSSQVIEYTLTGTPSSTGTLVGVWTKLGLNCIRTVKVVHGDATFTFPQTAIVFSVNDGAANIQGVIDNVSNQLTVAIPYTGGIGSYDAYIGTYTPNNIGTSEGGDANSFRLTYPSGTFTPSGSIMVTIEVDGDGSFNAEKQLFGIQKTIAALDFQVNGNSKGHVNLDVIGGIIDRNFADANHKFIYLPVTAADGNIWLNNNLGANYSNMNHAQFSPTQQATAYNDHDAYGSLYQWGRYSDGHELINYTNSTTGTGVNGITLTNATSDIPGDNLFITESSYPNDWRVPPNNNLWQGEAGINNPCPLGYRLPTEPEMNELFSAESITNNTTAANSSLAFTGLGYRFYNDGSVVNAGAFFWTSTVSGIFTLGKNNFTTTNIFSRGSGFGVRCIKD